MQSKLKYEVYGNMLDIAVKFMQNTKVKTVIFPKLNAKIKIQGSFLSIKDRKHDYNICTNNLEKIASELYTYFVDATAIDIMTEIKETTVHAKYCEDWLLEVQALLFEKIKKYL